MYQAERMTTAVETIAVDVVEVGAATERAHQRVELADEAGHARQADRGEGEGAGRSEE